MSRNLSGSDAVAEWLQGTFGELREMPRFSSEFDYWRSAIRVIEQLTLETPYAADAYLFVFESLKRIPRTMDANELCWYLRDEAIGKFGVGTRERLRRWNINTTSDWGEIVQELANGGLLQSADDPAWAEAFEDAYDFDSAFSKVMYQRGEGKPFQFRLGSLFAIMTIVAIAAAGIARLGVLGGIGMVFMSWMLLIGAFCFVRPKQAPSLSDRAVGFVFLAIGVGGILGIILSRPN